MSQATTLLPAREPFISNNTLAAARRADQRSYNNFLQMLRASCWSRRLAPLQEVGVPGLRLFVSRTGVNHKLKKRAEPFAIDEKGKPGRLSAAVAHIESQFGRMNSRLFI
jgi:hypothetical protein